MAGGEQSKGGKKNRKWNRNRYGNFRCGPACTKYIDRNVRFENKLRRVLKYNGVAAADAYDVRYRSQLRESGRVKTKSK